MSGPITFANEAELQAAMQRVLASVAPAAAAPAPVSAAPAAPGSWAQPAVAPASSWAQPAAAAIPVPLGVLVPLNLQGGDGGKVKVLLQFGPEYAEPGAMRALLGALVAANAPLDVWYPKRDGGGGGGGRGGRW